ncbi:hypothetical protein FGL91_08260 [Microbacterium sp. CBA3102]|uniref:hypothetical protein n=1 Tax=Microbacterium sp. CBA3102 TaxID=2603598 RepID=UPI0011BBCFB0|nr:hypothetical protein [Microbacterium sp. CBA3102]QEA28546.1 hypothetical protein FGL91_08260 [Microbacterium sp. CBA3102]
MQTLPNTSWGLIAGSLIVLALVISAAAGLGASSRVLGLHVPYISHSAGTWIGGHRAALWIVVPCNVAALVLARSDPLLVAGWLAWGCGIVGGGLAAMFRARRLMNDAQ